MDGTLLERLLDVSDWLYSPIFLAILAFQVWMLLDAIGRREWIWAVVIFIGWGVAAVLYYFLVYRSAGSVMRGFELPAAHDRRRIRELQAQIHHLDKAHHHLQLGDIFFQQGKLAKAESCYRNALARDPRDIDGRAHLGQCLLRQKRPEAARPFLEEVCAESPDHDYGHSMMALAETLTAVGDKEGAIQAWQKVTANHSYPRAKVQLAQLYLARGETNLARGELEEVLADDPHAPTFQRRRDRVWVRRAKRLLARLRA